VRRDRRARFDVVIERRREPARRCWIPARLGREISRLGRRAPSIDWATLLRRVHDVDALQCARGGRLKFKQVVTDTNPYLLYCVLAVALKCLCVQRFYF